MDCQLIVFANLWRLIAPLAPQDHLDPQDSQAIQDNQDMLDSQDLQASLLLHAHFQCKLVNDALPEPQELQESKDQPVNQDSQEGPDHQERAPVLDLPDQQVHKDPPGLQESTEDLVNQDSQERMESATQLSLDQKDPQDLLDNLASLDQPECPENQAQKALLDQSDQLAPQASLEPQDSQVLMDLLANQDKMLSIVLAHHARLCSRQRNALRIEQMKKKIAMI